MELAGLGFAAPYLLAALILLPLLWIILRALPTAPKRLDFPGYFFLKRIVSTDETASRTPWYILLIRLLALAALIIALAGPFLNSPERLDRSGPVLIVLDDGWAAADGWEARRNTLRGIAGELEKTDRTVWILTTTPKMPGRTLEALRGPLAPGQLVAVSEDIAPVALGTDRFASLASLSQIETQLGGNADIRWLSDGVFTGADIAERQFLRRLAGHGRVTAYVPEQLPAALAGITYRADRLEALVRLPQAAAAERSGTLSALARDGRLLQQTAFLIVEGEREARAEIELPLSLRNEIGQVRIDGERSAGAVQLTDASTRRALVGLAGNAENLSGTLLDSRFYLQQALEPYALFVSDTAGNLAASDATVIVLDDVGRLRQSDSDTLTGWVEAGGILIRFAGPVLADASQDASFAAESVLLPVDLRGGGRAFGGALTWEEPQGLGGFAEDSPFTDLIIDPDVQVRRQVLARPGGDTSERSWAWLEDGTPLVTARSSSKGLIVLFHVTAAPDWSDLPISGLFVQMLQRLTALSVTEAGRSDPDQSFVPRRFLSGFGRLDEAPDDARPVKAAAAVGGASALVPAGVYGDPATPLAVNTLTERTNIQALTAIGAYDGIPVRSYTGTEFRYLARWFLLAALILFLIDTVITLQINSKLVPPRRAVRAAVAIISVAGAIAIAGDASAQIRPPLDPKAVDAALYTRFAYVLTGDREVDEISRAGLYGLSRKLRERTALEPASPIGVSPASDDLSVYPMIYWPILPETPAPDENTLIKLEAYMAGGGLIIFDTRDGDRLLGNQQTQEQAALRRILVQLNVPPLEPLPGGHVLRRSFYLMEDLPGRNDEGPVWVESRSATGNLNDGVTPMIIGGRDWASAWAMDEQGRPLRPMGAAGFSARESAYRSGINIAMVALTGNYKVDQLQAEALLDKIGRER